MRTAATHPVRDQEGYLMCYTAQESPKLAGFESQLGKVKRLWPR